MRSQLGRLTVILTLVFFTVSCASLGSIFQRKEDAKAPPPAATAPAVTQTVLADLSVDEEAALMEELADGYGGHTGKVIKISPKDGANWKNYSKPVFFDLGGYSGKHTITISMSVLAERPAEKPGAGSGKMCWTIHNGTGYTEFGNSAEAPAEWTDLRFSQTIDLAGSGENVVFLDGLNEGQGLVDLTLYISRFDVRVEKAGTPFALTFDDGPSDMTGMLLDKLNELGIKATFFLVGMKINALDPVLDAELDAYQREAKKVRRQAIVRRMFEEGHEVANHSYTHNYLGGGRLDWSDGIDTGLHPNDIPWLPEFSARDYPLSENAIRRELESTQDAIQQAVYGNNQSGRRAVSNFFRMPFNSDETKATNLVRVAASMNLPIVYGAISSDYVNGTNSFTIANNIYEQRLPWGISISHDPQWSPNILAALDILIPKMEAEGYQFVTLSEMVEKRGRALTPGNVYYSFNPDFK